MQPETNLPHDIISIAEQVVQQEAIKEEVHRHIGNIGWVALGAAVLAWDVMAPETLSDAFARGLDNPRSRPLVIGALAVTGAHLLRALPKRFDPFHIFAEQATQRIRIRDITDIAP